MHQIVLDATGWQTRADLYAALLPALGAPNWHGSNLDALWDSVASGNINRVQPPYAILLKGSGPVPDDLKEYLRKFIRLMADAAAKGIQVSASAESALGL